MFSVFHRVFIADKPLPRSDEAFQQRLQAEKKNLVEEASRAAEVLSEIAAIYTAIRKQLKSANELSWALAIGDIQQQLSLLFAPGFIKDTPWQYLQQYPRYLTAIDQRLEKLRGHFQRDKQLLVGLRELSEPLYAQWKNNHDAEMRSEQLLAFRWLLEEYRVSLFAQKLGTLQPVSEKRLKAMWQEVKTSLLDVSS